MYVTLLPFLYNVRAGRLRELAVSGEKRRPQVPDIPTFTGAGLPAFGSYT
jgi:tripartite-type tricarboxylate transporter receptor subunit TctC